MCLAHLIVFSQVSAPQEELYGGVLHKCLPTPCRQENSAAFSEIAEKFLAPKIRDHLGRLPGQEPLKFRGQAPE
jgi:hypothetical protein